jgi:hypothetical protein
VITSTDPKSVMCQPRLRISLFITNSSSQQLNVQSFFRAFSEYGITLSPQRDIAIGPHQDEEDPIISQETPTNRNKVNKMCPGSVNTGRPTSGKIMACEMPKLPGLAIFRTLGFVFNEEVKNGQLHVLYVSNTICGQVLTNVHLLGMRQRCAKAVQGTLHSQ